MAFLTAVMQVTARGKELPLDFMTNRTTFLKLGAWRFCMLTTCEQCYRYILCICIRKAWKTEMLKNGRVGIAAVYEYLH